MRSALSTVGRALVVVFALGLSMGDGAFAAWQASLEQACGGHRGPYGGFDLRYVVNAQSCTHDCYFFTLVCNDGYRVHVASRYPWFASDTSIFMYENGAGAVTLKLLLFAAVGSFCFVATFGSKRPRERVMLENGGIAACFGLVLYLWGAGFIEEWHYSLGRFLDVALGWTMLCAVLPIFIAVNGAAFVRGWNYVFTAHATWRLLRPGLRSGAAIDVGGVAQTLAEGAIDPGEAPSYHYEHQAEKARKLKDRLDADSAAAETKIALAKARAEFAQSQRALDEAKRRAGKTQ